MMKAFEAWSLLDLPAAARVDQRVPKSLLGENGAASASDRRLIKDGVERVRWYSALKPATLGVPEFRDSLRDYDEIAVIGVVLRPPAKCARLVELTHRAIPYPVLLMVEYDGELSLSVANKRKSQIERDRVVLDGDVVTVSMKSEALSEQPQAFLAALAPSRRPHDSLYGLYQAWMDALLAVRAAEITGRLELARDSDHAARRRAALERCSALEAEMTGLRNAAGRTTQIARRADFNIQLQRLQSETGKPIDPPLLLVLDECANIAPLRDLATLASTGAGQGIQLVSVFQDMAQINAVYVRDRAPTIISNHRAKVILSGIADAQTLDYVGRLLGDEEVQSVSSTSGAEGRRSKTESTAYRSLAPANALREMRPGSGLLVYGHLAPARIALRPWFEDRGLRRLAG